MDKYEYRLKAEQIVRLFGRKKYAEAMEIAEGIDWNRVKNVQMLCTVSEVYEKNEKYEESREILYLAYDRSPVGRMIVYKLVELSIQLGDLKEAVNFFKEYTQLAPNDSNIYILKYKLYKAKNSNLEVLISILEDLKKNDPHEEWSLELARLYAQGNYIDECVALCDELDLYFNDGPYVMAALELKQKFVPLTNDQQEKYAHRFDMMNDVEELQKMLREDESLNEDEEAAEDIQLKEDNEKLLEEEPPNSQEEEFFNVPEASEEDNYENNMPEEEEDSSERRSGGVFSLLGRIGKAIVEPASDYDLEDNEEEEKSWALQSESAAAEQQLHEDLEQKTDVYENEALSNYNGTVYEDKTDLDNNEPVYGSELDPNYYENIQEDESAPEYYENVQEDELAPEYYENVYDENVTIYEEEAQWNEQAPVYEEFVYNDDNQPVYDEMSELNDFGELESEGYEQGFQEDGNYEEQFENALRNIDQGKERKVKGRRLKSASRKSKENNAPKPLSWVQANKYDTMNLQKELAKSIQQLLEATEKDEVDSTLENVKKLVEDSHIPELTETMRFRTIKSTMLNNWAKERAKQLQEQPEIDYTAAVSEKGQKARKMEEIRRKFQPGRPDIEVIPSLRLKPTRMDRKRQMEECLIQEDDGQIGFALPKEEMVEKQITGQLNIDDILRECERRKYYSENEQEKQALEEARTKALNETQEFMTQVMDLLNQCLSDMDDDASSLNLVKQLSKIQEALKSTKDLSEISKLNSDLSALLDRAGQETELEESDACDTEAEEKVPYKAQEEVEKDIEKDIEKEKPRKQDSIMIDDDSSDEALNRMLDAALSRIAQQIQGDTEMIDALLGEDGTAEENVSDNFNNSEKTLGEEALEEESPKEDNPKQAAITEENPLDETADDKTNTKRKKLVIPESILKIVKPRESKKEFTEQPEWEEAQQKVVNQTNTAIDPVLEAAETHSENAIIKITPDAQLPKEGIRFDEQETLKEEETSKQEKNPVAEETFSKEEPLQKAIPSEEEFLIEETENDSQKEKIENDRALYDERHAIEDILQGSFGETAAAAERDDSHILTKEQRKIFSYFSSIHGVPEQVSNILKTYGNEPEHMIITGGDGCGKTSLAMRIVKAQQIGKEKPLEEVAKIKAASLNSKDMDEIIERVKDGVLIIERAGALSEKTMKKLLNKLDEGVHVQLVLALKKKSIDRLRDRCPDFLQIFHVQVDLPTYTNKELVEFGKEYARVNHYMIEDMAILALFSRLGSIQIESGSPNLNHVKEIIDGAIVKAQKRKKKIFKRIFEKKTEEAEYLLEEDFDV